MLIKDLVMPINYFNLNVASSAINSAMYSIASLILVVSIVYEYLNDRDILGPIKRFLVAIILLTIALPVQNFVVEKSFQISDVLMNSLSDSDKLQMINDPNGFMTKLSAMQFADNTIPVTEKEEIGNTGVTATVTSSKTNFAGVIFDQLKNIPNIIIATITFGFISWCLYSLQASYYILYFVSGALFVIPAILSIFPAFESSLSGAFKSLGTLFVMPIFVSLIAAMLSIKMAEFGTNHATVGDSIHSVAIVASLCCALGSSIFISAGFLVASGVSQNLGAAGAMATAAVLSSAVKVGASAIANREAIANGARGVGGFFGSSGKNIVNTFRNTGSLAGSGINRGINKTITSAGAFSPAARGVQNMMNKAGDLKTKMSSKIDGAKKSFNDNKSHSTQIGRGLGVLKSLHKPSDEFGKLNSNMAAVKKSGFKGLLRNTGTYQPRATKSANLARSSSGKMIDKSHLLFNNKGNFKSAHTERPKNSAFFKSSFKPKVPFENKTNSKFSASNLKPKKPDYRLNKWEKSFMKDTAGLKNQTFRQQRKRESIVNIIRNGRDT
jgi:hypothetical protein